jgi:hypothetical protein
VVLLARDPRNRPDWFGVLVGAGALVVLIAYLNREGPGGNGSRAGSFSSPPA